MNKNTKHHILYPGAIHESQQDTKNIRRNRWLIPPIDQLAHAAIHESISIIPPLDRYTAGRVNREFKPIVGDYVSSVYELMSTIDQEIRNPRTGYIEIENAKLAMYALEMQIPIIKDGLIKSIDYH